MRERIDGFELRAFAAGYMICYDITRLLLRDDDAIIAALLSFTPLLLRCYVIDVCCCPPALPPLRLFRAIIFDYAISPLRDARLLYARRCAPRHAGHFRHCLPAAELFMPPDVDTFIKDAACLFSSR